VTGMLEPILVRLLGSPAERVSFATFHSNMNPLRSKFAQKIHLQTLLERKEPRVLSDIGIRGGSSPEGSKTGVPSELGCPSGIDKLGNVFFDR